MDAVTVSPGDCFLDIGSGDGVLVAAASLLYPEYLRVAAGIEIVPSLYERSIQFHKQLEDVVACEKMAACPTEFFLGDIYSVAIRANESSDDDSSTADEEARQRIRSILQQTTIAVCFATTWSHGMHNKRRLPKLSKALSQSMKSGTKIVIIDGRLMMDDTDDDDDDVDRSFDYRGEFRLHCPDTAPYSTARLYIRT